MTTRYRLQFIDRTGVDLFTAQVVNVADAQDTKRLSDSTIHGLKVQTINAVGHWSISETERLDALFADFSTKVYDHARA